MISSIIDAILLASLAGTSTAVLLMYRKLQKFDVLQGEAAKEFARCAAALDKAREAMSELNADGGDLAVTLANRLNEARMVMNDIEEATVQAQDLHETRPVFVAPMAAPAAPVVAPMAAPVAAPEPIVVAAPVAPAPAPVVALPAVVAHAAAIPAEVEEAPYEEVEETPAVSAAIRIRNAARARIEAAKSKAANAPTAAKPTLHRTPAPTELFHAEAAAARRTATPAVVQWPTAAANQVTWGDLARAAQFAS